MEIYVDFVTFQTDQIKISSSHASWVGAWWVGFLIFGMLTFACAPPFMAFPEIKKPYSLNSATEDSDWLQIGDKLANGDTLSVQLSAEVECNKIKGKNKNGERNDISCNELLTMMS